MFAPFRKTAIIVDPLAFRRALVEGFLEPWARSENLELISLQPESAHTRLIESGCDILIYNVGGTHPSSGEILAEIELYHALCPSAALVILSADTSAINGSAALNSGVHGYLCDSMPPELVLHALSFILNGGTYFPPAAMLSFQARLETSTEPQSTYEDQPSGRLVNLQERTSFAASNGNTVESSPPLFGGDIPANQQSSDVSTIQYDSSHLQGGGPQLTDRQRGILRCICRGYSNKIIARTFDITESTVKIHVKVILRKIRVKNRTQAAIWAVQNGLCEVSEACVAFVT